MFTYFRLILLVLFTVSCQKPQPDNITIAAAANMQFAITEISKKFTDKTGIPCHLVISSSGKLTAQIKEGAPYDILIAANMKYPNSIYDSGLASQKPKIYAQGQLVVWSLYDDIQLGIKELTSTYIEHIAIASPKNAPYGQAAIDALQHYGVYEKVKHKLVFAESIAQTNQFIISQSAQVGFTAKSTVLSPKLKNKGTWIDVDANSYTPIDQGVLVINNNTDTVKKTQQFYDFLFSAEAKKILEDFGYLVSE